MRVWVSGSRGKLGAEVRRQLISGGHDVTEADLAVGVDLLDPAAVADSMRDCEAIIHCAGIASPEAIAPADLVRTNTMTTFNALEEAWNQGIRIAVLASSGSIYGTAWSPDELPWLAVPVDEDTPLRYVDPYALTKDVLERTGAMYARRGMAVTALRFHWILNADEVGPLIDAEPLGGQRSQSVGLRRPGRGRAGVLTFVGCQGEQLPGAADRR
jgi:UDP-glucose 4-epimerase